MIDAVDVVEDLGVVVIAVVVEVLVVVVDLAVSHFILTFPVCI